MPDATRPSQMNYTMTRLLLALALLGGAAVAATSAGAATSTSPKARYVAALAAMGSETSVHYTASFAQGRTLVNYVGDVGRTQGTQRITIHVGNETGRVTVIVSGRKAWVRGDSLALSSFLDFPESVATKDANVWIVVPAADYASVAEDVTLGSAITTLKLTGKLMAAPSIRIGGIAVSGVTGISAEDSTAGRLTLYARASGKPLPVAENGREQKVVFSRWNEPISVTVPTNAVSVAGGATPSGPSIPA